MKKSGFLEGAFIATVAIFFTKFLGIIYVIPFYKIVGTQGGALYGYAYSIYNFFLIISSAGIPLAISKLTSEYNTLKQYKEKEYMYKESKKIIQIFSFICFLLCFILAPFLAKLIIGDITGGNTVEDITFVIRCVSFAILIVPILSISRGYLQGHSFIQPSSFSQVIEQIIRIIVIIFGSYIVLNILKLGLKNAIGVAVFGAAIGGIVAYLYLNRKLKKIKKDDVNNNTELTKDEKNTIFKKLISYSIPFIIISVANSLYNFIDMILLNYGLDIINYSATDIETISSVFTTWGHKLNTIVTSIATGVAISLIPSIAKNKSNNDYDGINDKFNKILQIFIYIALPLSIFMSIFSREIWTIFYGQNKFGPIIFKFLILTAAIDALYIMVCNALQGLNKSKLIYKSVITGLLLNLILDIPLILLFNKIGIPPYYGAIAATIIGYSVSLIIPVKNLKREFKINYNNTTKKVPKLLGIYLIMILICVIYRGIINNVQGRLILILLLVIIGIILIVIYFFLNRKELNEIIGYDILEKLRKKRDKK